jgi:predicted permease
LNTILGVTLPFFALIFFGYLAAHRRWVPVEAVPAFNGFLLYFAVPCMLFRFAASTPFAAIVNVPYFVAWAVSGVAVVVGVALAAHHVFGASMRDAAFLGLVGGVTNAGYLGVPLLVALMGPCRRGAGHPRPSLPTCSWSPRSGWRSPNRKARRAAAGGMTSRTRSCALC